VSRVHGSRTIATSTYSGPQSVPVSKRTDFVPPDDAITHSLTVATSSWIMSRYCAKRFGSSAGYA
jgi:hypothetical protein